MKKETNLFVEAVCGKALAQFNSAMAEDFAVKGALMPDTHAGYALPIGAVVATKGVVVPAWVGYDIGCGMCAVKTNLKRDDLEGKHQEIFDALYEVIPVGFNKRSKPIGFQTKIKPTEAGKDIYNKKAGDHQLGTLGGGNHFIEIGYDEKDCVWVTIHSGSRGVGHGIATHYMKLAGGGKAREGHFPLSVDSQEGKDYIQDLAFGLEFALANRKTMMGEVGSVLDNVLKREVYTSTFINRNHNHAELKDGLWIHRKGATHAEKGMLGVIPGNMRDGCFIVEGKGNPDALCSSSHGAGRVLGRRAAKEQLDFNEFAEEMQGVTALVKAGTLDESPMAYKNIFEVMEQQKDLVKVIAYVKPLINIKG